jgi:hypothetical protein
MFSRKEMVACVEVMEDNMKTYDKKQVVGM